MNYCRYEILADADTAEILTAELGEYPFDAFELTDDGIISSSAVTEKEHLEAVLRDLQEMYEFSYTTEILPQQNWNAIWEASFEPIILSDFCAVRASFHAPIPSVQYELVIDPKMAFGTGHHDTTRLMMQAMKDLDWTNKSVFDYGSGTGILAVLAKKLGADVVDAIDIEAESAASTTENAEKNGATLRKIQQATLEEWTTNGYDIILANINRNVILASLERLKAMLNPNGILLISGFLAADVGILTENAEKYGFGISAPTQSGDWVMMLLRSV